jgi:thiamine biosynthesis lipoprotein
MNAPRDDVHVIRRSWPAMGSLFEAVLLGDDEEHLDAVANAAREEVERVERLLSRFDARSELSRVNRQAASEPVRIDRELLATFETCHDWWHKSGGYFDPTCSVSTPSAGGPRVTMADVVLDFCRSSVRFERVGVQLDLGGFGKGYALDRAAEILGHYGVERFFLHGGTSSTLARGLSPAAAPWCLGVRDPWSADSAAELCQVSLENRASSCSAVVGAGQAVSDIIEPPSGRPLMSQAACLVLAPRAAEAEILSTALLAMGKQGARTYTEQHASAGVAIGWIERVEGRSALSWLAD